MVRFDFRGKGVRMVTIDGEPWFVAKDVCEILEIQNHRDALTRIPEKQKGVASTDTLGGMQNLSIISEAGLYRLVLRSDKPQAEPFIEWVTEEVLPQIRKTGMYMPRDYPEALEALAKSEREKMYLAEEKKELEVKLKESMEWYSIKRMERLNREKKFKWQLLKGKSLEMGIPIKKTFDQNYGHVNVYHKDVWKALFSDTINFE